MSMNRKSNQALVSLSTDNTAAWALPPLVRHRLDGVVRRAARGERDAIAQLAREFRPQMVEHAEKHLARFCGFRPSCSPRSPHRDRADRRS